MKFRHSTLSLLFIICVLSWLPERLDASSWEIHTFGGGELLTNVFNMVKLILYGNSKTDLGAAFLSFSRIILALGSVSGIMILIFKQNPAFYFKNFLLPSFFVLNILLVPRTDITIHDDAIRQSSTTKLSSTTVVQNVPFLYGAFLSLLSELSYNFTRLLEHCTHQVSDAVYNWTGRIYAGEYALRIKLDSIWDKNIESNFREFCRDCVWNDLERGLYSRKDLMKSQNLLSFLKERTSNLNTMKFHTFSQDGNTQRFLTCREAIGEISRDLAPQTPLGQAGNFIDKFLPTSGPSQSQYLKDALSESINPQEADLNFLLGRSRDNSLNNLRVQSGIIRLLKEELPGTQSSFTVKRAEMQNREGMKTTGAVAASTLVTMKNVFEALIYFSFPLVCLFALIPLMQHLLLSWMKACIWIATLAPFYVIINSILTFIWNQKKQLIMGATTDLTLFNYDGLLDLYDSMEAVAALAIGSIFTISLILTRSGFSGLSHALPSMFSSGQSAAQAAAAEKISGNYSFGNVSLANTQAYNYDTFKQNYSGSFHQGAISLNEASQMSTHDLNRGTSYIHQDSSRLRDSISQSESFGHSLQTQITNSQTAVQEESVQFSDASSATANHLVGLMNAYSDQKQKGMSFSNAESSGVNKTFQELDNLAQEYSAAHNCSYEQSVRDMAQLGLDLPIIKISGTLNTSDGANKSDAAGSSERYSFAETYSSLMQQMSQFSQSEVGSIFESTDTRKHEDYSDSWNRTATLGDQLRTSLSEQANLSHLEGSVTSDNLSVHHQLDQQFVDYLKEEYEGDMGLVNKAIHLDSNHPEKQTLVEGFISSYKPSHISETSIFDRYQDYKGKVEKEGGNLKDTAPKQIPEEVSITVEKQAVQVDKNLSDLRDVKTPFDPQKEKELLKWRGEKLQEECDQAGLFKNVKAMKGSKVIEKGLEKAVVLGHIFAQSQFIHYYNQEGDL